MNFVRRNESSHTLRLENSLVFLGETITSILGGAGNGYVTICMPDRDRSVMRAWLFREKSGQVGL